MTTRCATLIPAFKLLRRHVELSHLKAKAFDQVLNLTTVTQGRQIPIEQCIAPFLDRDSVANVQGLGSIPTVRLQRKLGIVPKDVLARIKAVLAFALDLESAPR